MKKIKTNYIATAIIGALSFVSYTYAAGIASVVNTDDSTLKVTFSGAVDLGEAPTGEIKVLKDIAVDSAVKDPKNTKVLNLTLSGELIADQTYSLISIFGAEGSIDFSLGTVTSNVEVKSIDPASTIEKIMIVDSKKIDVYYKADVVGAEFEFKILSNLGVDSIGVDLDGTLLVKTKGKLEPKKEYILMIVSLKNNAGKEVIVDDGIFDFTSTDIQPIAPEVITNTGAITSTGAMNTTSPVNEPIAPGVQAPISTNSGSTENIENTNATGSADVESVALNAAATPDTGAETWVLILGTLCINSFVYLYRRKRA